MCACGELVHEDGADDHLQTRLASKFWATHMHALACARKRGREVGGRGERGDGKEGRR